MKLGGHMDYHGFRAYASDRPSVTSESWVKRLAGPFTAWARHALEMLLKPGARQAAETMWLVHGEERHFSVLGADRPEAASRCFIALAGRGRRGSVAPPDRTWNRPPSELASRSKICCPRGPIRGLHRWPACPAIALGYCSHSWLRRGVASVPRQADRNASRLESFAQRPGAPAGWADSSASILSASASSSSAMSLSSRCETSSRAVLASSRHCLARLREMSSVHGGRPMTSLPGVSLRRFPAVSADLRMPLEGGFSRNFLVQLHAQQHWPAGAQHQAGTAQTLSE